MQLPRASPWWILEVWCWLGISVICFAIHGESYVKESGHSLHRHSVGTGADSYCESHHGPWAAVGRGKPVFATHWKQETWATTSRLPAAESTVGFSPALAVRQGSALSSALLFGFCCRGFFHWVKEKKSGIELYMMPEFSRYRGPFGPWLQQPECLWSLTEENISLCSSMHRNYPGGSVFLDTLFINGLFFSSSFAFLNSQPLAHRVLPSSPRFHGSIAEWKSSL